MAGKKEGGSSLYIGPSGLMGARWGRGASHRSGALPQGDFGSRGVSHQGRLSPDGGEARKRHWGGLRTGKSTDCPSEQRPAFGLTMKKVERGLCGRSHVISNVGGWPDRDVLRGRKHCKAEKKRGGSDVFAS